MTLRSSQHSAIIASAAMSHSGKCRVIAGVAGYCRALLLGTALLSGCMAPVDPEALVNEAVTQHENGEFRAAMINLKNALQADSDNRRARYELGRLYVAMGNWAFAEKELRKAERLGTSPAEITVLLGRALLQQRKFTTLLSEIVTDTVGADRDRAEVLILRGDAYLSLGNLENAATAYRQAGETNPDVMVKVYTGYAKVALARHEVDVAEKHIKLALELAPGDPAALLSKGLIQLRRRDMDAAEATFLRIVEMESTQDVVSSREFTAMVGLVQIYILSGRKSEAENYIEKLIAIVPEHFAPRYYKALLDYQRGDFDATVLQLQRLLKTDPDNNAVLMLMGAVKYAQGNLEQADMYLSVLISNNPENILARKLVATTRMQLEQPEYALEAVSDPDGSVIPDTGAFLLAGAANLQIGQLNTAIDFLDQAVQTEPDNLRIRGILARSHIEAGYPDEAMNVLGYTGRRGESSGIFNNDLLLVHALLQKGWQDQAQEYAEWLQTIWPDRPELLNMLGTILVDRGDLDSGLSYFENAIQVNPAFIPSLINLGMVERSRGRLQQAAAYYRQVLAIDPEHSDAGYQLAMTARESGDMKEAVELLEQMRQRYDSAIEVRMALAQYYLSRRDFISAKEVVSEAMSVAPERSDVLNMMGVTQMWMRDYHNAITHFKQVVEQEPLHANPLYNLARAQLAANDLKSAFSNLRKVLELKPNHLEAAMLFAVLELKAGNTDNALNLALQQQEKNSENPSVHILVGDINMVRYDYKAAAAAYRRAWDLQSSGKTSLKMLQALLRDGDENYDAPVIEWLAMQPGDNETRLKLANAYLANGRLSSAVGHFEKLLAADPDNPVFLNNLALLYHEQHDQRALEMALKAYNLAPRKAAVVDTLGWLYTETGKLKRGVDTLEQALSLDPDNQSIRDHLAAARSRLNSNRIP